MARSAGRGSDAAVLERLIKDGTNKDLSQLREEARLGQTLRTPAEVAKFMEDLKKPKWHDKVVEAWLNAILSGPKTHMTNVASNILVALYSVPETYGAWAVGTVRKALGREGQTVALGEGGARMYGLVRGAQEGVIAGWQILKNEDAIDGTVKVEARRQQAIGGLTGKVVRAPGRALAAEDQVFKAMAFRSEIHAQAYRTAVSEGREGRAFAERVSDLAQNPTDEMVKSANEFANYQTFNNELGDFGKAVQRFASAHPAAKFIIPFVRTPLNIVKFAQERSVLGLLSRRVRDNLKGIEARDKFGEPVGKPNTVLQDTAVSRMAMGTAVSIGAFSLALQGLMTGGGPTDPAQRAVLYASGWQPYSLKIGNSYYSYARMEPLGTLFGIAADMADVMHAATQDENDQVAQLMVSSITKNLVNKTWLQGPANFFQAVLDPDRYGANYIDQMVASFVPNAVVQLNQSTDPYLREAKGLIDTIKSRIPGLSETLMPKRDVWGNPISRDQWPVAGMFNPIGVSKDTNDKTTQTLIDLGIGMSKLKNTIRGVELTPQQYDDYARVAGRLSKIQLDQITGQRGFDQLPNFVKEKIVRSTISRAHTAAQNMVLMQNPTIIQQALQNKRDELAQ